MLTFFLSIFQKKKKGDPEFAYLWIFDLLQVVFGASWWSSHCICHKTCFAFATSSPYQGKPGQPWYSLVDCQPWSLSHWLEEKSLETRNPIENKKTSGFCHTFATSLRWKWWRISCFFSDQLFEILVLQPGYGAGIPAGAGGCGGPSALSHTVPGARPMQVPFLGNGDIKQKRSELFDKKEKIVFKVGKLWKKGTSSSTARLRVVVICATAHSLGIKNNTCVQDTLVARQLLCTVRIEGNINLKQWVFHQRHNSTAAIWELRKGLGTIQWHGFTSNYDRWTQVLMAIRITTNLIHSSDSNRFGVEKNVSELSEMLETWDLPQKNGVVTQTLANTWRPTHPWYRSLSLELPRPYFHLLSWCHTRKHTRRSILQSLSPGQGRKHCEACDLFERLKMRCNMMALGNRLSVNNDHLNTKYVY